MTTDKLKEIEVLFRECKDLKEQVYECHGELKNNYSKYKKKVFSTLNQNSDSTITDLKLLLSYLKKHNELKMIYDSYKDLLKEMLNYKKKIIYLSHISKPVISEDQLKQLLKEQSDIIDNVSKVSKTLPKF